MPNELNFNHKKMLSAEIKPLNHIEMAWSDIRFDEHLAKLNSAKVKAIKNGTFKVRLAMLPMA